MATIAIVHIGLRGHIAPATRLGGVLACQGHEVHAWGPDQHRDLIEASGARLHPHEPLPIRSITGGLTGFSAALAQATAAHVEELSDQLLRHGVDVVVHDVNAPWGGVAAEFLGLPRVVSYPLFPASRLALTPSTRPPLFPALPPGWQADVARAQESRRLIAQRWGVEIDVGLGPADVPEGLTINYTTPELLGDLDLPAGWRCVGPLLDPPPRSRPDVPPLVYVSLGTFFNFTAGVYRVVIDGLAEEPVRVLISTGGGAVSPRDLGPLPDNIEAVEFVDGREALARASLMVTHCGINSVHEALEAGVRVVCLPQGHDQFAWAYRLEQLGAGQVVEEDAGAVRTAVRALLGDEAVRGRARELGRRLLAYDGSGAVARVIEEASAGVAP